MCPIALRLANGRPKLVAAIRQVLLLHVLQVSNLWRLGDQGLVVNEQGQLAVTIPLDREQSPRLGFNISCTVSDGSSGSSTWHQQVSVTLLDEDDNVPRLQSDLHVMHVYLKNNSLVEGHQVALPEQLIFFDDDSMSVNRFDLMVISDPDQLFHLKNDTFPLTDKNATLVNVRLVSNVSLQLDRDYNVTIAVKDTTMSPGHGDGLVAVEMLIHPGFPPPASRPVAHLQHDIGLVNVSVSRWACQYTPVYRYDRSGTTFRLIGNAERPRIPLAITQEEGIVYVDNAQLLADVDDELLVVEVAWETRLSADRIIRNSSLLYVQMVDDSSLMDHLTCQSDILCAQFRDQQECHQARGAPAARHHGRCQWRAGSASAGLSRQYATCSTDLTTCPDGYCDALEQKFWSVCPQDCVTKVKHGLHRFNEGRRGFPQGIGQGHGVCWCDPSQTCSCNPPTPEEDIRTLIVTSTAHAPKMAPPVVIDDHQIRAPSHDDTAGQLTTGAMATACDNTCRGVLVTTVVAALLTSSVVLVICWRKRRWPPCKSKPRYPESVPLPVNLSEYIEDIRVRIRNAERHQRPSTTAFGIPVADRKWEIPREWLIIEQTLGEGEFGKVVRASVTSVTGISGHRVVAAKMTKTMDGRGTEHSPELQDLLSEFHLLKDVSHPNVIKLLGACTDASGPFLLILEYCEHGSLRNYLRRSRLADGLNPAYGLLERQPISPRDILSFAWQISQAMAYLSDMKLVHRDLAARNVLMAATKVCKVSDFGLTRDVYEGDTYLKTSKGRVPIKWMALESLSDHVYTSKSDVWSFGVLLWELSTLGANPYPGISPERLYRLLKTGYRMEKPDNCSQQLYELMLKCWKEEPHERPPFIELVKEFDAMLQVGMDYLDLNCFMVTNREYFLNADTVSVARLRWDDEEDEEDDCSGTGAPVGDIQPSYMQMGSQNMLLVTCNSADADQSVDHCNQCSDSPLHSVETYLLSAPTDTASPGPEVDSLLSSRT